MTTVGFCVGMISPDGDLLCRIQRNRTATNIVHRVVQDLKSPVFNRFIYITYIARCHGLLKLGDEI